jgi:hypothetical protein
MTIPVAANANGPFSVLIAANLVEFNGLLTSSIAVTHPAAPWVLVRVKARWRRLRTTVVYEGKGWLADAGVVILGWWLNGRGRAFCRRHDGGSSPLCIREGPCSERGNGQRRQRLPPDVGYEPENFAAVPERPIRKASESVYPLLWKDRGHLIRKWLQVDRPIS